MFLLSKGIESIRAKLEKAEPSRTLPKNASKAYRLKYELCEKFVFYLLKH